MFFHFVSIFGSGHIVEQESFESGTFDRALVAHYASLINKGEDFGFDLGEVHLEYIPTGPKTVSIEVSSDKLSVPVYLLGSTDPENAKKEINQAFKIIHNVNVKGGEEPAGELFQVKARPLVLALLAEAGPEARNLARYPIALAAAFFETKCK